MPMRCRCPPENSCGIAVHVLGPQPDLAQQLGHLRFLVAAPCAASLWMRSASPTVSRTRHARVEGAVGVLKDDLHVPAQRAHARAEPSVVSSWPSKRTLPAAGLDQSAARSGPACSCRSRSRRPGPASRPRRARSSRRSRRARDRVGAPEQPRADGELLGQALRPRAAHSWRRLHRSRRCGSSAGSTWTTPHAPASERRSGGCSSRQSACTRAQRSLKAAARRQHGAGRAPSRGWWTAASCRGCPRSWARSPAARACTGGADRRTARCVLRVLDDLARVHHDHLLVYVLGRPRRDRG